ncbi:MAG: PQQ-binding-like beta-propeller repeat protein [bacterium]
MRTQILFFAIVLMGCGPKQDPRPVPRREPARRQHDGSRASPPPAMTLAGCPAGAVPGLTLPRNIRTVQALGRGLRLITAGLRASELPPCTGRCSAPRMTLALVGGDGTICWRTDLPAEHRLGPAGRAGKPLWVAGPKQVFAVSWQGKVLGQDQVNRPVLGPIALEDGGAAVVDSEGHMVAYRANGRRRWRRKPILTDRPQDIHPRRGGGLVVAFAGEVRAYDADGVRRFRARLPDRTQGRRVAVAGDALWVWSLRGAYHLSAEGQVTTRQPPAAPGDGRVFAGALGAGKLFYAILAEKGFYPIKLVAVGDNDAVQWSRPYTGARPKDCRITTGSKRQLGVECTDGRVVVRDETGITRFDETCQAGRLALGPGGRYAVAEELRTKDMARLCRVRWFGATGDTFQQRRTKGKCPALWYDGVGRVYLGTTRVGQ